MKRLVLGLFAMIILVSGCTSTRQGVNKQIGNDALSYAEQLYLRTSQAYDPANGWPRTTGTDGKFRMVKAGDWTSGFYPGILWQLYEATENEQFRTQAERWTAGLEVNKTNKGTHDLGFMMYDSFGQGLRLTNNTAYKQILLESARSLASRYNEKVGAIQSWGAFGKGSGKWTYPVIIDNMMNLNLLFWAAKNGGDPKWADLARQHAITSAKYHVRPDGSTYHVIDFDPQTGSFKKGYTAQGYADESAWARGQAWAIYGFTETYRNTKDPQYLTTARKVADFFIASLPQDYVPYWDFRAPNIPNEERDASAAAIAASGLIELSTFVKGDEGQRYLDVAQKILNSLSQSPYLSKGVQTDALLLHSVGHKPAKGEVDVPLIYADYYFIEALLRLRNL